MQYKIGKDVFEVGAVDWNVREFHGYITQHGSSYNSYVILDEQPVVVDGVKAMFAEEHLRNIREIIDPEKIRWVICNHAEPDHAGGLDVLMAACKNATLVCDAKCRPTLEKYHDTSSWQFKIVKTGDSFSIGRRTLVFVETPMAHWPESMVTWLPEEKILFSMDAFGQHYASNERFWDEVPEATVMTEAKTYVANILMLYSAPVSSAVAAVRKLAPAMIAPSHGLIWRGPGVEKILGAYDAWDKCKAARKVLVLYDTMWQSTEHMAQAIADGAMEEGGEELDVKLLKIPTINRTFAVTELLDAAAFAIGSPTLNMTMLPPVADLITYIKGLKPLNKAGFAFGSYGWGRGGPEELEQILKDMNVELLRPVLRAQYRPNAAELAECKEAGRLLARHAAKVPAVAE